MPHLLVHPLQGHSGQGWARSESEASFCFPRLLATLRRLLVYAQGARLEVEQEGRESVL